MKRLIFDTGDIIAKDKWAALIWTSGKRTTTLDAQWRINKIATVGRAMDYMAQPAVGRKLLLTVTRIEQTLDAIMHSSLDTALLNKAGNLTTKHRDWFNGFMTERNSIVAGKMVTWASDASHMYTSSTPIQVVASDTSREREWSRTTSFLRALQTGKPGGWDGKEGVVGWYKW